MLNTKFYIGQIFENDYPPEAAVWCNNNGVKLTEITNVDSDIRKFQIVEIPKYIPTNEEIIKSYEQEVNIYLNETAQSKDYTDMYSCLSYLFSTDNVWKAEANKFLAWRDEVWHKYYEIIDLVKSGKLNNLSNKEFIAQLPKINW
jgi:hypothetical protein